MKPKIILGIIIILFICINLTTSDDKPDLYLILRPFRKFIAGNQEIVKRSTAKSVKRATEPQKHHDSNLDNSDELIENLLKTKKAIKLKRIKKIRQRNKRLRLKSRNSFRATEVIEKRKKIQRSTATTKPKNTESNLSRIAKSLKEFSVQTKNLAERGLDLLEKVFIEQTSDKP